ncbi:MAG: hypothetical protein LBD38_00015 [Streptococcaceae bacterium]|jgi:hypothetical protein|nr:hypothetical protein [Streptococcaceae bacterium]
MSQKIEIFQSTSLIELKDQVETYANDNSVHIVSISHEKTSSIMGEEVKAIVVFDEK